MIEFVAMWNVMRYRIDYRVSENFLRPCREF